MNLKSTLELSVDLRESRDSLEKVEISEIKAKG
jgi:hypothetical protein